MNRKWLLLIPLVVAAGILAVLIVGIPGPSAAQAPTPQDGSRVDAGPREIRTTSSPDWGGTWQLGPVTPFAFTRLDAEYFPADGIVYILGGRLADGSTDGSVWAYDPVAGTYTDKVVDLVTPISNYSVNLLDDANGSGLYVFCGRTGAGGQSLSVQVYYPASNTTLELPPADNYPGTESSCSSAVNVVFNNKVYVAGGFNGTTNTDETYVFDPMAPSGSRWTQLTSAYLTTPRGYIMGAVVDGLIYAIGGNFYDPSSTICGAILCNVATVEVLDPAVPSPTWNDAAIADLPEVCSEGRAYGFDTGTNYTDPDNTSLSGKIITGCGGWSDENNHVLAYDVGLNFWEQFPYLQVDRRDNAGLFVPVESGAAPGLWVMGGRKDSDANVLNSTEYYSLNYATPPCTVLLVDDDWDQYSGQPYNGTGTGYYTTTLENLGYPYDRWDVWTQGDPSLADLQGYSAVVWFTGYAWNGTITSTNEADLAAYLSAGGSLLVSSEDYLYEMTLDPFGQTYLGISTYMDDVSEIDITGNTGDPVGDGLGPFNLTIPTSWPSGQPMYTDYADAAVGASAPFKFITSNVNNSTDLDSGTFKSIFLAWPFEGLASLTERTQVMGAALNWLCGPPPVGDMQLVPPAQTGSGAPSQTIDYTYFIVNGLGQAEDFSLEYSSVWQTTGPASVSVPIGATVPFTVSVTIPADVGCFALDTAVITATAGSNPAVFDVATAETTAMPAGTGEVAGFFLDANTGAGIQNGLISMWVGDLLYYETYSDAAGAYSIGGVEACTYEGMATAFGYSDQYGLNIPITATQTTELNIEMAASWPVLGGLPARIGLPPDSTGTFDLTLDNIGGADLAFYISEVPVESPYPLPMTVDPGMPSGVDAQVYADLAASPDGTATFIVYMAQQADLSAAYSIQDWTERGQYVLDTLRGVAAQTQAALVTNLQTEDVPYESRYIVNAVVIKGDLALVTNLAARPEVGFIGANTAIPAPAPVEILPAANSPDTIEWNILMVGADQVWSTFNATGQGIVVSNMDTGVQWDHPALVNQYRGGVAGNHDYNWWDPYGQSPLVPNDADAHGTHTMGTMVGSDNPANPGAAPNAIGMAPGAQWMACDGFDDNTGYGYDAELLECAEFLLAPWDLSGANPDPAMRPDVINNSWGGGQGQWWYNQAIYAWQAAGIFGVFSNGNAGPICGSAGSPGDGLNILSVGATTSTDVIAGFSSRGPAAVTELTKPNVSAPGQSIRSSVPGSVYQGGWSGTSMAAPHVAGEAALIWSAVPELRGDVELTYWIIEQTAEAKFTTEGCGGDLPDTLPNNTYGWGRIDAFAAVSLATGSIWDITWLAVDPAFGTVAPGASETIALNFDTTGLTLGQCYTGTLRFDYNDPYVTEEFTEVEVCVRLPQVYLPTIVKH